LPSAPLDPATQRDWPPSGCQDSVGYVVEMDPGGDSVSCWLDIQPQHLNRNNLLHGGFVAMLLDIACGYAASLHYDPDNLALVLTVSLSTQYIAPARGGRVTATGRVSGGGKSLCHANGELRDSDGALIATATGVFKRIAKGPKK
jgi:acyl-coenzyme A thioesterase 13